jgi:superfamily II DNA or RNA helicase
MQLGPARFVVKPRGEAARRTFSHRLVVQETDFRMPLAAGTPSIQDIYAWLASDEPRNRRVLDDIIEALEEGRSPLVLTERKDHLEYFAEHLRKVVKHVVVLQGGLTGKQRRDALAQLASIPPDRERLVLATGRYIGEGFDDARLDTLFLAMPISWKGTLVQYTGRLHRVHPGKTEVRIYDYVDVHVPVLRRMFDRRLRGYRAIGYTRVAGLPSRPSLPELRVELDRAVSESDDAY